jgi:uncharacterized protein
VTRAPGAPRGSLPPRPLTDRDEDALEAFAAALPACHLHLRRSVAVSGPGAFLGAFAGESLAAIANVGVPGSVVVAGDPAALRGLAASREAARAPWRVLVGRAAETDAWLAGEAGRIPHVARAHPYLSLASSPAGAPPAPSVERAVLADLSALTALAERFQEDEIPAGVRPRARADLAARARSLVAAGASFVVREDGRPIVRIDVPIACEEGALLAGIVTDPAHRRRGLARSALSVLCARLLASGSRRVMLHVAEENVAARALYERLGFAEIDRLRVAYAT